MDKWVKHFEKDKEIRPCDLCGKDYETYPIILDANPLSIAAFLEDETNKDGTRRYICKECRRKEIASEENTKIIDDYLEQKGGKQ